MCDHCASTDGARRAQNCALYTSVCFVVSVPLFAMCSRLFMSVCRSQMFVNMRCRIHSLYRLQRTGCSPSETWAKDCAGYCSSSSSCHQNLFVLVDRKREQCGKNPSTNLGYERQRVRRQCSFPVALSVARTRVRLFLFLPRTNLRFNISAQAEWCVLLAVTKSETYLALPRISGNAVALLG